MTRTRPPGGFTYLEVVFAIAVFGITLAGLESTVVTQLRLAEALERRDALLAFQGTHLGVDAFAAATGDYAYSQSVDDATGDVRALAAAQARALGVATLAYRDVRAARLPAAVAPALALHFDAAPSACTATRSVSPTTGLVDDGATGALSWTVRVQ